MKTLKGFLCAIHGWAEGYELINRTAHCKECVKQLKGETE